ncbi:MAG: hypothetical protein ACI81R_003113, partial [Bradymonadia bacterium]
RTPIDAQVHIERGILGPALAWDSVAEEMAQAGCAAT